MTFLLRGEVWGCDLGDPVGHEQGMVRPVVVVSHDRAGDYGLPIVLPITRTRLEYPTHVELDGVLPVTSYVQCEQIRAVSAERLTRRLAVLDVTHVVEIEQILRRLLVL